MTDDRETRERIFEAAADLIAAKGYAATTVREIAAAAGVNLAMIHYYFGNKEGLYRALIEAEIGAMREMMLDAAAAEGTHSDRIAAFVRAYVRFLASHPHFARIAQQELLSGGQTMQEVFRPQVSRNYTILRKIVDDGIAAGEFRAIDAEITPVSLIGMIAFFMIARPVIAPMLGVAPEDPRFGERLAEHTIGIFLNGARAPAEGASRFGPSEREDAS